MHLYARHYANTLESRGVASRINLTSRQRWGFSFAPQPLQPEKRTCNNHWITELQSPHGCCGVPGGNLIPNPPSPNRYLFLYDGSHIGRMILHEPNARLDQNLSSGVESGTAGQTGKHHFPCTFVSCKALVTSLLGANNWVCYSWDVSYTSNGRLMEMVMDITVGVLRRVTNKHTVALVKLLSWSTFGVFSSPDLTILFQLQTLHRSKIVMSNELGRASKLQWPILRFHFLLIFRVLLFRSYVHPSHQISFPLFLSHISFLVLSFKAGH